MSKLFRWSTVGLLATCVVLQFGGVKHLRASTNGIVISQVYGGGGNSGATYTNDFVELYNAGTSAVDITGWTVQYASSTGSSWQKTTLAGSIGPGAYYLVQEKEGSSGTVSLPTPNATGTIPMAAGSGKVALVANSTALTGTCPTGVVDFVGFGSANCSETNPTPTLSNTTAALRKGAGTVDTDNNLADFTVGAPNPRNSTTPPVVVVEAAIHDIQGSGTISPLAGQSVVTTGIVTGVKYNGFFIEAPEAEWDADSATSEGVFVFTGSKPGPPAAAVVGNLVKVSAAVSEYKNTPGDPDGLSLTELTGPTVDLISTGTELQLPAAVALTSADLNPAGSVFQLEKYEGMRVHLDEVQATGPTGGSVNEKYATATSDGLFFAVLPGTARPFREAGIETPLPVPSDAPAGAVPPVFDANPERIGVDTFSVFSDPTAAAVYPPPAGTTLDVTTGVFVTNVTGPLDYAYRSYIIDAEGWNMPEAETPNAVAVDVRARTGDEFTVATMNLERFYDTVNDAGSDVALTETAFATRLSKASLAILGVMKAPNIVGVEEVENLATLQALAARLNDDAPGAGYPGLHYEPFLMDGHDPSNINVGFLVNSNRVTALDVEQIGADTEFDGLYLNDRPSLVLRAQVLNAPYDPYPVTVVVNHPRSLLGIDGPDGSSAARIREKRLAQAVEIGTALQAMQANGEHVISVGDYNSFDVNDGYVDVMGLLSGTEAGEDQVTRWAQSPVVPPLVNLLGLAPAGERYSLVFDGNAQALDHILASSTVTPTGVAYVRMNADFPEAFYGDATRPERLSDHDPVIGYFYLPDIDTTPPSIGSVTPSIATLWAPNHKMAPITVGVSATDLVDPAPVCRITGVTGDDGATANDWLVTGLLTVSLRSERLGKGSGRTYTIDVRCTDASGNVSSPASTTVFVPHDQGKRK